MQERARVCLVSTHQVVWNDAGSSSMRSQLEQYQITLRMQFRNHNLTTNIFHVCIVSSVFDPSHPLPIRCKRRDEGPKSALIFRAHETATTRYQLPGRAKIISHSFCWPPLSGCPSAWSCNYFLDFIFPSKRMEHHNANASRFSYSGSTGAQQ